MMHTGSPQAARLVLILSVVKKRWRDFHAANLTKVFNIPKYIDKMFIPNRNIRHFATRSNKAKITAGVNSDHIIQKTGRYVNIHPC